MLNLNNLSIKYFNEHAVKEAVKNISFSLNNGEKLGIVGESGCGKTSIINAILRILPGNTELLGDIQFEGQYLNKSNIHNYRGNKISYISQNFYASLSDNFTIKSQFNLLMKSISNIPKKERKAEIINKLKDLGFKNAIDILDKYPFQLAGGMRQRVIISLALLGEPILLLADEPTSAVDSFIKKKLLNILNELNRTRNLAILIISHDLSLIGNFCDRIIIMFDGEIIEEGRSDCILNKPKHPYTKLLLESKPDMNKTVLAEKEILNTGFSPCTFFTWCKEAKEICKSEIRVKTGKDYYLKCNNG